MASDDRASGHRIQKNFYHNFRDFCNSAIYQIIMALIFLGIGAMTDFGPLLANPKTILLGAAAQLGIFTTLTLDV